MDKVKITYFGIGCRIAIGKFSTEDWKRLYAASKIFGCPLSEAIFDSAYFLELSDNRYKKWYDLGNRVKVFGLLDHRQSSIEIKINGKKQSKIQSSDLVVDNLLFPLYQTTISDLGSFQKHAGEITIVEKEIGTIGNYYFEVEKFSIENLHFLTTIVSIPTELNIRLLTTLIYSGKELVSKKPDTLVKERFALL